MYVTRLSLGTATVRDMDLGAFSISLPVADLERSREFYATLGFEVAGCEAEHGYLILRNGLTLIGIFNFDNMDFDAPMLTFNPGLTQEMGESTDFTDVRDVSAGLRAAGHEPLDDCEPDGTGPAHVVVLDPDGHRILVDQFVDKPGG